MIAITTVRAITWPRPAADGLLPVKIKISVKGCIPDYIPLPFTVDPRYWNNEKECFSSQHPNAKENNEVISQMIESVMKRVRYLTIQERHVDAKTLKDMVMNKKDSNNFFEFTTEYLNEISERVEKGTIAEYKRYIEIVENFHGSKNLTFAQMDKDFFQRYEKYMNGKYSSYSVSVQWSTIQRFIKKAHKRGIIKEIACTDYTAPAGEPEEKDYFSLKEFEMLEKFADSTTQEALEVILQSRKYRSEKEREFQRQSENMVLYAEVMRETAAWVLFGCSTGLRISDWRLFDPGKQILDKEIRLRAKKNSGYVSIPLVGHIERAVERIKKVPPLADYHTVRTRMFALVKALKIDKHITPHSTRKTFATTMCAAIGMTADDCADFMGITLATCKKNYYRVTDSDRNKRAAEKWKNLKAA